MKITELAKLLDRKLEIRFPNVHGEWYASFHGGEIMSGGMLISEFGTGATPQGAISDYVRAIAGKRMAFGVGTSNRIEFEIPVDLQSISMFLP